VSAEEIGVCILDRPRHGAIIDALRSVGARVHLIGDGDIVAAINCAKPETGIDMYIGQGGAAEGVLAAAALKCLGGQFQGRFVVRTDDDRMRAERSGIEDPRRKFTLHDLAPGEAIFIATGVTNGSIAEGAKVIRECVRTHSLVLNSATKLCADLRMQRTI
jgi:fructose-1,6-bisphosphatase II / sedoheptulose-1,7-bisphosphatase